MKIFSAILELKSAYQSGPKIGEEFLGKAKVKLFALNERSAKFMIDEEFGPRLPSGFAYTLVCEGESDAQNETGFAVQPLH